MTKRELETELLADLATGSGLLKLRELLVQFAHAGGAEADARATLKRLRTNARSESEEDRILELLDIVEGFVRANLRVW